MREGVYTLLRLMTVTGGTVCLVLGYLLLADRWNMVKCKLMKWSECKLEITLSVILFSISAFLLFN